MTRTVEPELMTEHDQAAAYAAADFSEVNQPIAAWFQARFPPLAPGARLLDIGCGTADMTIRLVHAYPGIAALGIDGSEAMLSFGRDLVNTAGLDVAHRSGAPVFSGRRNGNRRLRRSNRE